LEVLFHQQPQSSFSSENNNNASFWKEEEDQMLLTVMMIVLVFSELSLTSFSLDHIQRDQSMERSQSYVERTSEETPLQRASTDQLESLCSLAQMEILPLHHETSSSGRQ